MKFEEWCEGLFIIYYFKIEMSPFSEKKSTTGQLILNYAKECFIILETLIIITWKNSIFTWKDVS